MKKLLFILLPLFIGCASQEILPEKVDVKVTRNAPPEDCKPLGVVTGRTSKLGQSSDDALADLKQDAARKGANYVKYDSASALGTALQGTAYYCP